MLNVAIKARRASLVMLESISAKCPVIASKGSNADIFEYVNAGIIADTHDQKELQKP